jgi:glycosyltransferase involved in cell wall biosynthesis
MQDDKIPVSALIGSFNEGYRLENCLRSLSFCDEIFVVNLGSEDNTREVALKYATRYEEFRKISIIEEMHPVFIPKLKHDWFILIDPDEVIRPALAADIKTTLEGVESDIAALRVPMFNYFGGKKLLYTTYGGMFHARLLYRRSGINVNDNVHTGISLADGFMRKKIKFTGDNYDEHYWCSGWKQLFEKHRRYVKNEGKAMHNQGIRYNLVKRMKQTATIFYFNFKTRQGYKGGVTGWALSCMAARYTWLSWGSLRRYQRTINR